MQREGAYDHLDDMLRFRIAELLRSMSCEMEQLGEAICNSFTDSKDILEKIQAIDKISQTQKEIANILISNDLTETSKLITLDNVNIFLFNKNLF